MKNIFLVYLVSIIMIGNIFCAHEEIDLEEGLREILSLSEMQERAEQLVKIQVANQEARNANKAAEMSEFGIPDDIKVRSLVFDEYMEQEMNLQIEPKIVDLLLHCKCGKKTPAGYAWSHQDDYRGRHYKEWSKKLMTIFCLDSKIKSLEENEKSSKEHFLIEKLKKEKELQQQLRRFVKNRQDATKIRDTAIDVGRRFVFLIGFLVIGHYVWT